MFCADDGLKIFKLKDGRKASMQYELVTAEPIAFGIQKGLKISFRGVVVGFLSTFLLFFSNAPLG